MFKLVNTITGLLLLVLILESCTTFYLINDTDRKQEIAIEYKNSSSVSDREIARYQKSGIITNKKMECDSTTCRLNLELAQNRVLPLTLLLHMGFPTTEPREERMMYVYDRYKNPSGSADTLLYKAGRKFEKNKFKLEFWLVPLGQKKFIYRIK